MACCDFPSPFKQYWSAVIGGFDRIGSTVRGSDLGDCWHKMHFTTYTCTTFRGAGDRLGDHIFADCVNLPCEFMYKQQTQHSPDLIPKFELFSLILRYCKGGLDSSEVSVQYKRPYG